MSRLSKIGLLVGYACLALAVVVARRAPAASYELSVYAATPTATWLALFVALLAGAGVALAGSRAPATHTASLGLIGAVGMTVYAMPVLRGYAFYGAGDSLSHVGWAREIAGGTLEPTELLYPGIHTLTVIVGRVAGVPLALANEYVVLVAVPAVFLLFVPASVRLLVDRPEAAAVGLLAAVSFAPINNVSVHPNAHPASQTILLFAVVLYLAIAVAAGAFTPDSGPGSDRALGGSVLLAVAATALVFVHPQQALNVAGFLGGMAALQLLVRWHRPAHSLAGTASMVPYTVLVLGAFMLWTPRFERATGAVMATVEGLLQGSTTGAAVVSAKSTSLTSVGGSLPELFLKLFGAAAVLSLLAAALFLLAARRHRRHPLPLLLAAGLLPVVGVFFVVFAANLGDMYFRYHGFLMVPITVAGAVGLLRLRDWLGDVGGERAGSAVVLAVLLVLAPAGLVAVHASPYMYQPSQHVTAATIDGHEAAFEHRDPDVPFTGLRGGPRRYVDYHYGTQQARDRLEFPGYREGIRPAVFEAANYSTAFEEDRYVVTSQAVREQEIQLYDGFRYPERGFRALSRTPGVDRVRANDGFWLYYAEGGGEA
ncbi:hypothetical protein B4589_016310 (plasmid) [Halolamina sp. CBA1230]|uniref:hypothetical protein n=1 Tax=Halolamina sp. CBA1230 TaxID=1853690 RepID=UPI0009A164A4|nr:hypothetical protein [Halolamina sp. CBA1230]QKY21975.1 hypothetical protein B4589_016310 [Halolamina sp. CBA1230]